MSGKQVCPNCHAEFVDVSEANGPTVYLVTLPPITERPDDSERQWVKPPPPVPPNHPDVVGGAPRWLDRLLGWLSK